MDIRLTDEQELLRRSFLSFAGAAHSPDAVRDLEKSARGFDPAVWRRMSELGWTGVVFDPAFGGAGLGMVELAVIVEACGQTALPSPIFSAVVEAGLLLAEAGSQEQKERWLPRVIAGDALLTAAVLEANGGREPAEIQTTIEPAGDGYRIRGTKLFVRDAATADGIICVTRSGPEADEITLTLVPRETPGIGIRRLDTSGGEPLFEVRFDGVEIPAEAILGAPGRGWTAVRNLQLRGAAMKAAELTGIGQSALDLTTEYSRTRQQFGRPIGSFQAVQHHLADMYRDLQACRLLTYQAADALAGRTAEREVALAKAKTSEAIPALTRLAHQIHGGVGYYTSYPLELFSRRALAAASAYGNAAYHRRALGRILRERASAGGFQHLW
jgi:alkylation response protein AidB-like acyl-CoA dehydrogenase